jgi:hypothetical protein
MILCGVPSFVCTIHSKIEADYERGSDSHVFYD